MEHKDKRQIESKLAHIKPLGESDEDDDSAQAWVSRSRTLQEERVQAEKRVRIVIFTTFCVCLNLIRYVSVIHSYYCGNHFSYLYLVYVWVLVYHPQVECLSSYHELF